MRWVGSSASAPASRMSWTCLVGSQQRRHVPEKHARDRGDPAPPQDIPDGDVAERFRSSPQRRRSSGASVDGPKGEAVEKQVDGARRALAGRESPHRAADFRGRSRRPDPHDEGGAPGGQVGLAGEFRVDRLEPLRGLQQPRGGLAGDGPRRTQCGRAGGPPGRAPTRRAARPPPLAGAEAASNAPAWRLVWRRGQRALGAPRGIGRQRDRALQERSRSGNAAAGLRPLS